MNQILTSSNLPLSYVYGPSLASGRISLPVPSSQVYYASFEHVSGVPAMGSRAAYSVDKLKILDVLIDRLVSLRESPLIARENRASSDPGRVDALIEQYTQEIRALSNAPPAPYAPAPMLTPGSILSIAA